MKLLLFIHSLGRGGAERVSANLANSLAREGWTITVVTLAERDRDRYALDERIRRISLQLDDESSNGLVAIRNNARRILALRQTLRQERPLVALAMMNTASVLLAIASAGLGIPTIGAERAHPATARLGIAWSWLRDVAYRHLSVVVALTPEAAQWLKARTRAATIVVIPNSVTWPLPEQTPVVDPTTVGRPNRNRILAVGRLARVKGFDNLLGAFASIAPSHPDWELVVIGEGPERSALQAQIKRRGLTGQVILAGEVGNLSDWYGAAKLFTLSSRHEGFPNVLLEAMAHGLACVSFDCEAGPRNIIRDGVDGVLVRDQDVNALASSLERLMDDEEMRLRYAARAVQVRDRFAPERILCMWRELITKESRVDGRIEIGSSVSPRL